MIAAAREKGAHIDVEALVSETGSTFLGAEFLAPEALPHFSRGFTPADILYYGEPIPSEEELVRLRKEDPTALIFLLHRDSVNNLQHPLPHSEGMRYVIVHGTPVISEGKLVVEAKPGRPVRREEK